MQTGMSSKERVKYLEKKRRRRAWYTASALILLLVMAYFVCLAVGSVQYPISEVWDTVLGKGDWSHDLIINQLRAPRLLCAAMAGAALSLGGVAMQALFKNPMASASVLGVSSGASFGAAFYIAYGFALFASSLGTVMAAFGMAMLTMIAVYVLAYRKGGGVQTTMLLLAGMAISALFSGGTSMIEFFSDADTVTSIVFWILGSFDGCVWSDARIMFVPIVIGMILISLNAREMNLMTTGESKARSLGVNIRRTRLMILVGSSILVAGTVSICGVISFVGLIIPHIFRTLVGPDHKRLIPICILGGALFMMVVDTFARTAMMGMELPVGTVTSIIGAPFFLWIMRSRKAAGWRS